MRTMKAGCMSPGFAVLWGMRLNPQTRQGRSKQVSALQGQGESHHAHYSITRQSALTRPAQPWLSDYSLSLVAARQTTHQCGILKALMPRAKAPRPRQQCLQPPSSAPAPASAAGPPAPLVAAASSVTVDCSGARLQQACGRAAQQG